MAGGPDPLGKRALYWMSVDTLAGEHGVDDRGLAGASTSGDRRWATGGRSRPAGKHALYSDATPAGEAVRATSSPTADEPVPRRGILTVACSTCGAVSRVGLLQFMVLQVPVGAWFPRRQFDRWMTCPACRRRTWTSVTLSR